MSKNLYGVPIKDSNPMNQEELVEKYQSLKNLRNFLQSMDHEVLMAQQEGLKSKKLRKKEAEMAKKALDPMDKAERVRFIK
tara:strand:- start:1431 stop:1673 length:243 start_codon:yes stop_codon:yes gene_type:complete